ncbi:hypothetical protein K9N68_00790 [Kovacikia minuta CCNUW1]|uniref:hypothetical protein n=1 Tax=Kovacikia minuta TaxID=2931930 RepID=UPI001CCECC37|nr:hypothetical protein [Kovacikia minuta]UBF26582.1 hypothetical protein K9N68_00790 [Kovacikia minuta CCNUW1]
MEFERDQELAEDQNRCLERLNWAVLHLGGKASPTQIDRIARLIIQTMTGPWRFFHTPEHIFEVGETGDAVEILAALFHDLVYVQVDQGVSVNISAYISAFVKEINGKLVIRDSSELPDDRMFEMVTGIFGFSPEQVLIPTAGQNEFLSAVIAAKCLEHDLQPETIAQIAACIEATIPFRSKSESGQSPSDRLYERLQKINQSSDLGWSKEDLDKIVERSVRLANRDVKNFAYPYSADFLDNTWNLLPETNHDLKNANSYTVQGYRESLQKMEGFMHFLKPHLVFQRFGKEPDEATYQELIHRTGRNLDVARLYLGSKLLSIAIIEALSRRIGRDIPVATMTGELPSRGTLPQSQLENFLPTVDVMRHPPETDLEWEVLGLLEKGRNQSSIYDIKNSPVTTFLIKSVGFGDTRRLLPQAKAFFAEEISPEEFLQSCDPTVVETITNGILQVFESRKAALKGVNLVK